MATRKLTHQMMADLSLHKLLEIGLRDVKKHAKTPGCVVYMGTWLETLQPRALDDEEPEALATCFACMAGSVMKQTFGMSRHEDIEIMTSTLPEDDRRAACEWTTVLDHLRCGQVDKALTALGRDSGKRLPVKNRKTPVYSKSPAKWFKAMEKLHAELKAANI
jgi:hypothetical protein